MAEPPLAPRGKLTTDELIAKYRDLPQVDYPEMRQEADEFFGTEDRIGDNDNPWERRRD